MGHQIHRTTIDALRAAYMRAGGVQSQLAKNLGLPNTAVISKILSPWPSEVSREKEMEVRVALGLSPRHMTPSALERKELQARLKAHGVTFNQALRIALDTIEGEGNSG